MGQGIDDPGGIGDGGEIVVAVIAEGGHSDGRAAIILLDNLADLVTGEGGRAIGVGGIENLNLIVVVIPNL